MRHTIWVGVILVVLLGIRLSLPYAVKSYVNRKLNESHDYSGRISGIDMSLWRGSYRIHAIEILRKSAKDKAPFFAASWIDLSIEWKELFHGSVVGQVAIHQPQLNFISGPPAEETVKSGKNESWDKLLESLFPFKLNRLEINEGEIHFQNVYSTPPVDISLKKLSVTATNLTNARDLKQELPAGIVARSTTIGGGGLDLNVKLNPVASAPTYQMTCQLTNVDLTSLNDFLKAYGKFDVQRGNFAIFTSIASKEGSYEGYVKVFFDNLKVFQWDKEKEKNPLQIAWQAIVGALTTVFKNHHTDSVATKVPVSGTYESKNVGIWSAITTLLRNAFIQALVPKVDESMTLQDVKGKQEKKEALRKEAATAEHKKGAQGLVKP